MSSRNKSDDRYSKEKSNSVKHSPQVQKNETDKSRSMSASHTKGKSPKSNSISSRERIHSGNVEDRSNYSRNRHVYRTDDNPERHKLDRSYHSSSRDYRDNQCKATERNCGRSIERNANYDERLASKETKLSSKSHRSEEDLDKKLGYNEPSGSPNIDYTHNKHSESRLVHDNRQDKSPYTSNKSSEFSQRRSSMRTNNFHNTEGVRHYESNYHFTERGNNDNYRRYDNDFPLREQTNDERHISFKNKSASGDDEFVASLLQKIEFLSNQVEHLTQENILNLFNKFYTHFNL